jgi:hypothetical protein
MCGRLAIKATLRDASGHREFHERRDGDPSTDLHPHITYDMAQATANIPANTTQGAQVQTNAPAVLNV